MKTTLTLESLNTKELPSATLFNSVLSVNLSGSKVQTLSVESTPTSINVIENGMISSFDSSLIGFLAINGTKNGRNVIQNNTSLNCVIIGGKYSDSIFGGTGSNFIQPGAGNDNVYSVDGTNIIDAVGGVDRIFTSSTATVFSDKKDLVVRFKDQGTVSVENNILYISATNEEGVVNLSQKGGKITISYDFNQTDGFNPIRETFSNIKFVAYKGGTAPNIYINQTCLSEVVVGGVQGDYLKGGFGKYSFIRGGSGNDQIFGNAVTNELSGDLGNDQITLLRSLYVDIIRSDMFDTIVGNKKNDIVMGK
jgi:Ca2+-binding RTX toxin-like protein